MFNRLKISISKPGFVFAFVKDKASNIFKHLLLMMLIMGLPIIIAAINKPEELFPSTNEIAQGISKKFLADDLSIIDNKLVNPNHVTNGFIYNDYAVIVGDSDMGATGFVIHFKTNNIEIYAQVSNFMKQPYKTVSYEAAGLNNTAFTADNVSLISNQIINLLLAQGTLKTFKVFQVLFANIIEYLFIALLLTFLFRMSNRLPLPFKSSFAISVYLTSIWGIILLILTLFGLAHLSFIALLVVYIYHIWAYRSISVIRKIGVEKKDDNE